MKVPFVLRLFPVVLCFVSAPIWGKTSPCSPTLDSESQQSAVQIGGAMETWFVPSFPQFPTGSLSALGPRVSVHAFKYQSLVLEALYAYQSSVALILLGFSYKWIIETPFFSLFVLAGPNYLTYQSVSFHQAGLGWHVGSGVEVEVSRGWTTWAGVKWVEQASAFLSLMLGLSVAL